MTVAEYLEKDGDTSMAEPDEAPVPQHKRKDNTKKPAVTAKSNLDDKAKGQSSLDSYMTKDVAKSKLTVPPVQ